MKIQIITDFFFKILQDVFPCIKSTITYSNRASYKVKDLVISTFKIVNCCLHIENNRP